MNKNKKQNVDTSIKQNYKESWLFFKRYYKGTKKWVSLIIVISLLVSATTIILPFLTSLIPTNGDSQSFNMIIHLSILLIVIAILKIILYFFLNYIGGIFDIKIEILIREEMMDKLHSLSMETFDNTPIGVFFSRILNDLKEIKIYASKFIQDIITIICLTIGGFSFIFYIDWVAGLITLSIYLVTLIIYFIFKQNLVYHQQVNKTLNTFMSIGLGEHVQMVSEIKSFDNAPTTIEKFNLLQKNYFNSTKKYIKKSSLFKLTGIASSVIISTTVLIIGSLLSSKGIIEESELLGLVMASNILIIPIERTSSLVTDMIIMNATIVRIKEFHDWKFESNEGTIKKPFAGEIEFNNVCFSYYTRAMSVPVLKNFNLKISKNETTLLHGEYAQGKTTIFKLLMRYYELESGEILIDGINIKDYEINYLRRNIAYQAFLPKLFSSSLELTSLYPDTKRYSAIIKSLELEDLIDRKNKLDRNINSQGLQVSDSEKQMLSVARALYFDTFIILFDLPEHSLNSNQINAINKTLKIYAKNKTIIFSSYNKDICFQFDNDIQI